jgi:hypothetical protein
MNTSLDVTGRGVPFLPRSSADQAAQTISAPNPSRPTPGHFQARVDRRPRQTPYKKDPKLVDPFQPKSANVTEVTDALAAVCQLSDEIDPAI